MNCFSKKMAPYLYLAFILFICTDKIVNADDHVDMIVDQDGDGDYRTVTEAIDALPMYPYQRIVIYIRNGIYEEKIRVEQNYITLRGEHCDSTVIRYAQLRSDWNDNKDHIGPAVVNLHGDDIILDNLTIENTQSEIGPHAFAIYGDGTRIIITNCRAISRGGDTVSLWNYKEGMYYHANCTFRGAVDFVCPRGWCFIRDSQFYEVKETAALWHAGNYDPDQKCVILNTFFDGVRGFQLGRHHYEAQFYFVRCYFSSNMADKPIYRHTYLDPERNNPYFWGKRTYFHNCQKEGEPLDWIENNFNDAVNSPKPENVTAAWTFGGRWNPESREPPVITDYTIEGKTLVVTFNEIVTVRGRPEFKNQLGKRFKIVMQRFNDIHKVIFTADTTITDLDISGTCVLTVGDIIASVATDQERSIGASFQFPNQ